jgi:hypothetical protein
MENLLQLEREGLKSRWPRILALLTCLVTTLVVADQGVTIDKQRELIHLLWGDSKQLTQMQINSLPKPHADMYVEPETKVPSKQAKPPAEKVAPEPRRPNVPSVLPVKPARLLKQI